MCSGPIRNGPSRETSQSSGGFSHSQTGMTADVPVTASSDRSGDRPCSSERHRAAARSTNPFSGVAWGAGRPVAPSPASSSVTGLRSRPPSTSQISTGTWPRGRCPFNQRETAVCS